MRVNPQSALCGRTPSSIIDAPTKVVVSASAPTAMRSKQNGRTPRHAARPITDALGAVSRYRAMAAHIHYKHGHTSYSASRSLEPHEADYETNGTLYSNRERKAAPSP